MEVLPKKVLSKDMIRFDLHPKVVLHPVEDVPVMIVVTRKVLSMGMIRFDLLQQVVNLLRVKKEHRKEFFPNHQRPPKRRLDVSPVLNQYF